ncbi:uncharacterized protein DNG_07225 [Cephalotrichum gorgonifer]|uniref:FG-GAP domain-containing protein n=1 Tax=Cephalotrichum gorgonifer TaxID=2041049 RepID=A0AAE8N477_9PEZI|nr:uncharacterized protein DNG_07225 [Cephalotrichum gorgonifer]
MQARTDAFNKKLRAMIKEKQSGGKHTLEVPIEIGKDDLSDEKHPNDIGYALMAQAWYEAIMEADQKGWLKEPAKVDPAKAPGTGLGVGGCGSGGGSGSSGCKGGNWESKGTVFNSYNVWDSVSTIMEAQKDGKREKVILADLNGDGRTDYVLADDDGTVRGWLGGKDLNPSSWTSLGKINPSWKEVNGSMVRMADVNGDGKADMIALYPDGSAKAWANTDSGKKFESLDADWASGLATSDKVSIVDVDGDGYADYVIVYEGGNVKWARNTKNNGKDPKKKNWESAKTIAPGVAGAPANRARLVDLDGDGKADYTIVYDGGGVRGLINTGNLNSHSGDRNWDDVGTVAPGISGVSEEMIRFADMDGDGIADFLAVESDGSIRMWKVTVVYKVNNMRRRS